MKFTRYLQDTQTSEWKKAYIDYHRLRLQLGIIRAKVSRQADTWSSFGGVDIHVSPDGEETYDDGPEHMCFNQGTMTPPRIAGEWTSETDPTTNGPTDLSGPRQASSAGHEAKPQELSSFGLNFTGPSLRVTGRALSVPYPQAWLLPRTHRAPPVFPLFRGSGFQTPPTLHAVLSSLPPIHAEFFDMLDAELEKIETFYTERAKEMHERAKTLRKQLDELGIHRQMFYDSSAHSGARNWAKRACLSISPALSSLNRWFRGTGRGGRKVSGPRRLNADHLGRHGVTSNGTGIDSKTPSSAPLYDSTEFLNERWNDSPARKHSLGPHEYRRAKKRLRHAVVEHYRGLEILNNYRTVNLTGFRKALRKYGKITKISVIDAYMKDKVDPSAFGSGAMVSAMLKEMEHLFAARFEHGDRKRAMSRLRVGSSSKTYHTSMFRSGMWLGLAVPAIGAGCYLSFQKYTRETLPSWNILLFIYSVFIVPVLLALLTGINVLAWADNKISYVFIFRLNLRSRLDHHEYFELPSFLLCTLSYAFWFSLAQIGHPMLWPLIWFAFTFAVMFNPHRSFMWGGARRWMIKQMAKLAVSGMWEIEFTDAWLGDQLCSLVYSLSNLYFVGCFYTRFSLKYPTSAVKSTQVSAYATDAQEAWSSCNISQNWVWYYFLSILPFMVRLAQNLRRYRDSKLPSHLLNAGKYGTGMVYYFFYCYWRHQLNPRTGKSYILWFFVGIVNAIYGCVWDIVIDWGLCKSHARYPFLRSDLIYESRISWYYISMVSNIFLRFTWMALAFVKLEKYELCAFAVALLEVIRRLLWNFYRLEHKHLHNTGLHRIMHEAPLPYKLDLYSKEGQLKKRIAHLS